LPKKERRKKSRALGTLKKNEPRGRAVSSHKGGGKRRTTNCQNDPLLVDRDRKHNQKKKRDPFFNT